MQTILAAQSALDSTLREAYLDLYAEVSPLFSDDFSDNLEAYLSNNNIVEIIGESNEKNSGLQDLSFHEQEKIKENQDIIVLEYGSIKAIAKHLINKTHSNVGELEKYFRSSLARVQALDISLV